MYLKTNDKSECCGCLACIEVCPSLCLTPVTDEEGFVYPEIDNEKCIHCDKCVKVCPSTKNTFDSTVTNVYAGTCNDTDTVSRSSSGGVYPVLAKKIISEGGVVYAVALTSDLNVEYVCIDCENDIKLTQGSKYVQCILTHETLYKIKNDLKNNRKVLFVGTPCQVAAIKNQIHDHNLVTIDFVCHGVPSKMMLDEYIRSLEIKHRGKVVNLNFRNKEQYGWSIVLSYDIQKNGEIKRYYLSHKMSGYFIGFLHGVTLRESCYKCNYSNRSRPGDITLCDYWGCDKYTPELMNQNGVSLILVNSENGQGLVDSLNESEIKLANVGTVIGLSDTVNKNLSLSTKRAPDRDFVYIELKNKSFRYIDKRYFRKYVSWKERMIARIPRSTKEKLKKLINK